jgi:hypothetical protein
MKGAGNGGGSARIQDVLQLNDLFESLELRDPIASFERFIKILTKLIEILSRQGERRPERIRQHPAHSQCIGPREDLVDRESVDQIRGWRGARSAPERGNGSEKPQR